MLDNDDLDNAVAFITIAIAVTVSRNEDECSERKCEKGEPVLLENECRCLERAKP